ncbi:MAG TPA: type VI secretion system tip protein TssI/VgrG [Steroidobacteraceae bacterium]|nr:type VI secretion system tip protein TssI/VgrG [Steroidobacteraceae bacterium]
MPQQDKFPVKVKGPQDAGELLFERMSCTERLAEPFCIDLSVLSERTNLSAKALLGQSVTVSVELPAGSVRPFNGLVTRFVRSGERATGVTPGSPGPYLFRYQLRLQPWLWFLSRTADCRIFQNKNVTEIFETVVKGHGFSDYRLSVTGIHKPLEYCVQYRETDLNFLSRLLEAAGIFYYFEHSDGKHVMVLGDDGSAFTAAAGYASVQFIQGQSGRTTSDAIDSWSMEEMVQPGTYAATDYNFETPKLSLLKSATHSRSHARSGFEVFDYPAGPEVLTPSAVEQLVALRLDEAQAAYERYHGTAPDCGGLRTGAKFKLKDHPRSDFNDFDYAIVATEHTIISNQYSSGDAEQGISVSVEAINAKTRYRPPRITPKPSIQGAQTAVVVGPSGEEIYVDKYGRVKVQFPWDRYGSQDENSSCWMRVAQVWAGRNWGAIHTPRIGQEVLVSFLEGDPDRPIITGRVYNADLMPPYALPADKTQSGVKSRSSPNGDTDNFNEIRFEDKKGSELLNVQAEKDFNSLVKNDETTEVKHDRTDKVGNNETVTIEVDQSTTIKGQETRKVSKDRTTNVDGTEKLTVGKDQKIDVGAAFELVAADQISLTTGQSSLVMKKDGTIELKGMTITIEGTQTVTVKGNVGVTVQVSSTSVKLDPAQLKLAATMIGVEGSAQTQVKGAIVQVSAQGMAQISGPMIMIG